MEFFLFAGLMALDMLLFFFLASRYTYVQIPEAQNSHEKEKPNNDSMKSSKSPTGVGLENKGFADDTPM